MSHKLFDTFIVDYPGLARQLLTQVLFIPQFPYNPLIAQQIQANAQGLLFNAVWDTGASHSVITPNVVAKLNISNQIIGFIPVQGVNSKSTRPVYMVGGIVLPHGVTVMNCQLTESELGGDVDLLIGMDIISKGDLVVLNINGKTRFQFSLPPKQKVVIPPQLVEVQAQEVKVVSQEEKEGV